MSEKLRALLSRATLRAKGPWGPVLRQPRVGIMLHYTAGTDYSAVQWLLFDPACTVSYNDLVLDDGTHVIVAPESARAYHAGVCRPDAIVPHYLDANSAFYGIAIAAEEGDVCTKAAMQTVVNLCVRRFTKHGWPATDVPFRITEHARQAWPRGRKIDCGAVLPLPLVQRAVFAALTEAA